MLNTNHINEITVFKIIGNRSHQRPLKDKKLLIKIYKQYPALKKKYLLNRNTISNKIPIFNLFEIFKLNKNFMNYNILCFQKEENNYIIYCKSKSDIKEDKEEYLKSRCIQIINLFKRILLYRSNSDAFYSILLMGYNHSELKDIVSKNHLVIFDKQCFYQKLYQEKISKVLKLESLLKKISPENLEVFYHENDEMNNYQIKEKDMNILLKLHYDIKQMNTSIITSNDILKLKGWSRYYNNKYLSLLLKYFPSYKLISEGNKGRGNIMIFKIVDFPNNSQK